MNSEVARQQDDEQRGDETTRRQTARRRDDEMTNSEAMRRRDDEQRGNETTKIQGDENTRQRYNETTRRRCPDSFVLYINMLLQEPADAQPLLRQGSAGSCSTPSSKPDTCLTPTRCESHWYLYDRVPLRGGNKFQSDCAGYAAKFYTSETCKILRIDKDLPISPFLPPELVSYRHYQLHSQDFRADPNRFDE
ncbi:hypothetical protein EV360DRAFT_68451 [Lentinula raphanica]|nr:hypothetical protein EV360DRAFT_68451 [Lentinula raphanica]